MNADLLGSIGGPIGDAFARMDIAEEEIARAGDRPGLFLALCPPVTLAGLRPEVYRAHCREICGRRETDFEEPTGAEILAALAEMSLAAPFRPHANWLYWQEFEKIFPGQHPEPVTPAHDQERALELRAGLARTLRGRR